MLIGAAIVEVMISRSAKTSLHSSAKTMGLNAGERFNSGEQALHGMPRLVYPMSS